MENDLLTVNETEDILNIGHTKFYQLLGSGQLKAVKIGSRTFCKRSDVNTYIEGLPSYRSTVGGINE